MLDVILDPSALRSLSDVTNFATMADKNRDTISFHVPSIFFEFGDLDADEISALDRYFVPPYPPEARRTFANTFPEICAAICTTDNLLKNVRDADGFQEKASAHAEFVDLLYKDVRHELVGRTLGEEWIFMNEYSFIGSRTKAAFNAFMRAGAPYFLVGKRTMDKWIRATVNKPIHKPLDAPLTTYSILRASCKYVAAGGASIGTTVIPGGLGIGAALTSGIFLIMDP
jgi:hypothetical protein